MRIRAWSAALCVLLLATVCVPVLGGGSILRDLDRRAIPMLVWKSKNLQKYGTGVIVGPTTILTANHVAAGNKMDVLLPKGAAVKGEAVCRASYEDIAVLQARLPRGTPYYTLSSKMPSVGETVKVGGYPNRKWKAASGRVTHIISSATLGGRRVKSPMIVFKPALHQGASGAPVLNRRGQVVGIFVASNRLENYSIAFPTAVVLKTCRKFLR